MEKGGNDFPFSLALIVIAGLLSVFFVTIALVGIAIIVSSTAGG